MEPPGSYRSKMEAAALSAFTQHLLMLNSDFYCVFCVFVHTAEWCNGIKSCCYLHNFSLLLSNKILIGWICETSHSKGISCCLMFIGTRHTTDWHITATEWHGVQLHVVVFLLLFWIFHLPTGKIPRTPKGIDVKCRHFKKQWDLYLILFQLHDPVSAKTKGCNILWLLNIIEFL